MNAKMDVKVKAEVKEERPSAVTLTVEVPAERVDRVLEEVFRRVSRDMEIPGFRRGHVPRRLLEARLGKDFLDEDAQSELIEEALPRVLEEHALEPVSRPVTRILEFGAGKPFRFEVEVEVLPQLELPDLASIEVTADPLPRPTPAEVDRALEELRLEHATLVPKPPDSRAEAGDSCVVRLPNGAEREITLHGESALARQLIGHRAGEAVEVELEGLEGRHRLELVALKAVERPDDAELAALLNLEDEEALQGEVASQLEEQLQRRHERATRLKVLDAVVERMEVEVPPRLKEEVLARELEALERSGSIGPLSEQDRADYAEGAQQRLKREIVLETVKRQQGLKLTEEEFEAHLVEEAQKREMNPVKFKALLEREGRLQSFRSALEDERALDFLCERVKVK